MIKSHNNFEVMNEINEKGKKKWHTHRESNNKQLTDHLPW